MLVLCWAVLLWAVPLASTQDAYQQGVVNGATLALAGTAVVGLGALALKAHQNRRRRPFRGGYGGGYYAPYSPYHDPYYGGYGRGLGGGYDPYGAYQVLADYQQPQYQETQYHAPQYQETQYHAPQYQTAEYYAPQYQDQHHDTYAHYRRRRAAPEQQLTAAGAAVVQPSEESFQLILAEDRVGCALRLVCDLEARAAAGQRLDTMPRLILDLFSVDGNKLALDENTARGQYQRAAYLGASSGSAACTRRFSACQYSTDDLLSLLDTQTPR